MQLRLFVSATGVYAMHGVRLVEDLLAADIPRHAIRLISADGILNLDPDADNVKRGWAAVSDLFLTPVSKPWLQVLCCPKSHWSKLYSPPVHGECDGTALFATLEDAGTLEHRDLVERRLNATATSRTRITKYLRERYGMFGAFAPAVAS